MHKENEEKKTNDHDLLLPDLDGDQITKGQGRGKQKKSFVGVVVINSRSLNHC